MVNLYWGENGNKLITRRQLNPERKKCPAPQSHTNTYRLSLLLTPNSFGWTLPIRHTIYTKLSNIKNSNTRKYTCCCILMPLLNYKTQILAFNTDIPLPYTQCVDTSSPASSGLYHMTLNFI